MSREGPMAAGEATGVNLSRKFVSEAELDEKRKKRQEEWEKVRKPDDPEGWRNGCRDTVGLLVLHADLCVSLCVSLALWGQRSRRRSTTLGLCLNVYRSRRTRSSRNSRSSLNSVSL